MKTYSNTLLKFLFIFLGGSILLLSGCKQEGCTDLNALNYDEEATKDDGSCEYAPGTVPLSFHIHPKFGATDLTYGTEVTDADGRKIIVNTVSYYVSGIQLNGASPATYSDVYLLAKGDNHEYEIGEIMPGTYDEIVFSVGLDSATNHTDPTTYDASSALAPQVPNHHWSWASGYIFIKLEGMVDTTAAMSGTANVPFEMHVGMDNMLRTVTLATNMTVQDDATAAMVSIKADYSQFFNNVDWTTDQVTHTMDNMPLAMTVANNVTSVFTLMQ